VSVKSGEPQDPIALVLSQRGGRDDREEETSNDPVNRKERRELKERWKTG
jgi:hypothetical protein